ncbi:tripartite tricarboxylate transporter substrate-binding protein [Marinospirillum alkaliphilum]|uniref:Tripartite-type tricarboxylate transporter, receptor component TctC n=1 Tax=Marinospirillum alkaliphilum DSM 21637 TaxID=1122209 RepID=A0A1K1VD32_9GAMM|nr:tripartite tricarboxylate transporter substrate-binding protein [Marinospirillum alkaliphilum]SFX23042.1 Tripartite-type tricarboxylate transporter, receptor component TctC [Marinospirillum alkaliphilum DSM 21637]
MKQVVLLLLLLCLPVSVAAYPERPLTLLVGFNPGGSVDRQAQLLVELLQQELGQPVELLHYPGAGGAAAAAMLAASSEQGYVLQYGPSHTYTFTPLVSPTSYDLGSFRYVAAISRDQLALVTSSRAPWSNWAELLKQGRQLGELSYATQILLDRYLISRIASKEGINLRILPTGGGAGMAGLVLAGDADFAFSGGTHSRYLETGEMRLLAAFGEERLLLAPEVPTLQELGYDLVLDSLRVITVPADTPDDQLERLVQAFASITQNPRFIKLTRDTMQLPVVFHSGTELQAFLEQQSSSLRSLVEQQPH